MGFCNRASRLVKVLLASFNILLAIVAIAFITICLSIKGFDFTSFIKDEAASSSYDLGVNVSLGFGVFILLTALLGCCGSIRDNRCLLTTYAAIMLVFFLIFIVITYLSIHFDVDSTMDKVKQPAIDEFRNYFNDPTTKDYMDKIQEHGQCCGIEGASDYNTYFGAKVLPDSCCSTPSGSCLLSGDDHYNRGCLFYVKDVVGTLTNYFKLSTYILTLIFGFAVFSSCCLLFQ